MAEPALGQAPPENEAATVASLSKGGLSGDEKSSVNSDSVLIENDELKIRNGFGAQFWVTDSEIFFLNWLRTDIRNLAPVTRTRRNIPLYIAVFVLNPGSHRIKGAKRCDVTYDYEVLRPDGGCLDAGKSYIAWASKPPPPAIIELALGNTPAEQTGDKRMMLPYPRVIFGVIDPPGEYIVNVLVHDNVKKVDIALQRKLLLQE
jgi:hypothetical protein